MKTLENVTLVMSHFGDSFPRYMKKNIKLESKLFPQNRKIFLSDNPKVIEFADKCFWDTQYIDLDNSYPEFKNYITHDLKFRNGYWFKVIARLLALEHVFKGEENARVIQIESDVRLFGNFPFREISQINEKIGFTLHSHGQGVASVLFLRGREGFEILRRELIDGMRENGKTNDMEILFQILKKYPEDTFIFPTSSGCPHLSNDKSRIDDGEFTKMNFKKFNGCFDDLSYGLFLFGWDPRNNKGRRLVYSPNKDQYVIPRNIKLELVNGILWITCSKCQWKFTLFNFHIHSKNYRIFSNYGLKRVIRRLNKADKMHPRYEFTFAIVRRKLKFVRDPILRRLRKVLSKSYIF